jgi:hypothetical protein
LSSAPVDTSIERLAWLKCQRYFVERANQDAESEAGWEELVARKFAIESIVLLWLSGMCHCKATPIGGYKYGRRSNTGR